MTQTLLLPNMRKDVAMTYKSEGADSTSDPVSLMRFCWNPTEKGSWLKQSQPSISMRGDLVLGILFSFCYGILFVTNSTIQLLIRFVKFDSI